MSSYRCSSDANSDVEEIALDIFNLNPVAAHRFLDSLEETCEMVAEHPLIGSSRPNLAKGCVLFRLETF
jgi:plasmid stabilization system protein ParE